VDKGLADEQNGVRLMKPIDTLDELLERGQRQPDLRYQDAIGDQRRRLGMVSRQSSISSSSTVPESRPPGSFHHRTRGEHRQPRKAEAETLLRDALQSHLSALPDGAVVMLKLSIPTQPGLYAGLAADSRVLRVLALSGGYRREEAMRACSPGDPSMIASFSRACSKDCPMSRPTSSSMPS